MPLVDAVFISIKRVYNYIMKNTKQIVFMRVLCCIIGNLCYNVAPLQRKTTKEDGYATWNETCE